MMLHFPIEESVAIAPHVAPREKDLPIGRCYKQAKHTAREA
jgi:hypothetical protein